MKKINLPLVTSCLLHGWLSHTNLTKLVPTQASLQSFVDYLSSPTQSPFCYIAECDLN